ncbi:MAG: glutamine amidotransferase [Proteobacteria bacterium]|nr:glutamine amidotransferase [Pseudomonadota bacterium]
MKKVIVIRHAAIRDLGSFHAVLKQENFNVQFLEAEDDIIYSPVSLNADLLVILGGPMCANDQDRYPFIKEEIKVIKERIKQKKPVLGISLGAQLIAKALGSDIYPAPHKEIGFRDITMTAEGEKSSLRHFNHTRVLHWHGDTFDLPKGATLLASTELCPNQAFSYNNNVLGIQFHPQVTKDDLAGWFECDKSRKEVKETPGVDLKNLERQREVMADRLEQCARWFLKDWLRAIGF